MNLSSLIVCPFKSPVVCFTAQTISQLPGVIVGAIDGASVGRGAIDGLPVGDGVNVGNGVAVVGNCDSIIKVYAPPD